MKEFSVVTALLGGLVLVLALGSKWLATSPLPPTVIALVFGVVVGPEVLGLIDLAALGDEVLIREKAARLGVSFRSGSPRCPNGRVEGRVAPGAGSLYIGAR